MLRDYQNETISKLFSSIREGNKRVLVVLSCGAGKSTIFSKVCELAQNGGRKVLFVVHRKKLVHQFKERLQDQFGINSGLILSGNKENRRRDIQVASIQTLIGRDFPDADLIIFDEAHHIKSNQFMKVVDHYSDKVLVGLTATPERLDGSGLGDVFTDLINPIKMQGLIDKGYLVGTKVYVPSRKVDTSKLHVRAGEFIESEMFDAFNSVHAYADVVAMYKKYCNGKKMIVFNVNVKHSILMTEYFNEAGVPSAHIDGTTPDEEREEILQKVKKGEILVINNVAVFIEGLDVPSIDCCALNRATNSKTVYVQTIGRSQRPSDGKDFSTVLDFGGNTERHGYVEWYDLQNFELSKTKAKKSNKEDPKTKECPVCHKLSALNTRICECGYEWKDIKEKVVLGSGVEMELLEKDAMIVSYILKMKFSKLKMVHDGQLLLAEKARGYKKGWASHVLKERDQKWLKASWNQLVTHLEGEEFKLGLRELRMSIK